jgi:hypothetical protein
MGQELLLCDPEDGGCDRYYAVFWQTKVTARTIALADEKRTEEARSLSGGARQPGEALIGIVHAERKSPAWEAAWVALGEEISCRGLGDGKDIAQLVCETGAAWEYMGSERKADGQLSHCFRHRYHPVTHQREYLYVGTPDLALGAGGA